MSANGGIDTLRLTAEEALGLVSRGEVSARELCGRLPRRDRRARPRAPLFPDPGRRAARRRDPDRAQGRDLHQGGSHDGGLEDPGLLRAGLRRDRRRALQGRRADAARQDEHGRVRDGLVDRELRLRADAQPVGPHSRPGRFRRRLRRGGRGRARALGARLGHGRLDQAQPAAFCGIVGLRPTYGTVSRFGVVAFASSLDQVGAVTKTVRDNALLYRIIAAGTSTTRPPSRCRRSSCRRARACRDCGSASRAS